MNNVLCVCLAASGGRSAISQSVQTEPLGNAASVSQTYLDCILSLRLCTPASQYPGLPRTRRALVCQWMLASLALLFKIAIVMTLQGTAITLVVLAVYQLLDGKYADGSKVIAMATSFAGAGFLLIKFHEKGITKNRTELSAIEHILLKFDMDESRDFERAYSLDPRSLSRIMNQKHFEYLNALREERLKIV